jgi:hypothetical protein
MAMLTHDYSETPGGCPGRYFKTPYLTSRGRFVSQRFTGSKLMKAKVWNYKRERFSDALNLFKVMAVLLIST